MAIDIEFRRWTQSKPPTNYEHPPVPTGPQAHRQFFLLANETWDDFGFSTHFIVHAVVASEWRPVGSTAIGCAGMAPGPSTYRRLGAPPSAQTLSADYFSLGQTFEFYEQLSRLLPAPVVREFLEAIGDVVASPERLEFARAEAVFRESLTRSNSALEALDRAPGLFGREIAGAIENFQVDIQLEGASAAQSFHFDFGTTGPLPKRLHVLVGLNGSGKTQSLAAIGRVLSRVHGHGQTTADKPSDKVEPRPTIYGVVAISFSAFDEFVVPKTAQSDRFKYQYCGLRSMPSDLDAADDAVLVRLRDRFKGLSARDREEALRPVLPSLDVPLEDDWASKPDEFPYEALSAGQRIVLSIASELVRHVSNRVLVLMDEPETHLHPQLLSGLLVWMNELLKQRSSFAILATHSPVVVQQVPASATHVLRRRGNRTTVSRPEVETFGANLTDIVREVFEDRLGDQGYEDILLGLWERHGSAAAVLEALDGQVGMNGRVYLQSLDAAQRPR